MAAFFGSSSSTKPSSSVSEASTTAAAFLPLAFAFGSARAADAAFTFFLAAGFGFGALSWSMLAPASALRPSSMAPSSLASSPTGEGAARGGAAVLPFAALAGLRVLGAGSGPGEAGRRLFSWMTPSSLPSSASGTDDGSRSGDGGSGFSFLDGAAAADDALAGLAFVFAVEADGAGVGAVVVRLRPVRLAAAVVVVVLVAAEGAFFNAESDRVSSGQRFVYPMSVYEEGRTDWRDARVGLGVFAAGGLGMSIISNASSSSSSPVSPPAGSSEGARFLPVATAGRLPPLAAGFAAEVEATAGRADEEDAATAAKKGHLGVRLRCSWLNEMNR